MAHSAEYYNFSFMTQYTNTMTFSTMKHRCTTIINTSLGITILSAECYNLSAIKARCHNQHGDIQHNNTQHNDILHNETPLTTTINTALCKMPLSAEYSILSVSISIVTLAQ
jgi:hypothetical protein